MFKSLRLKLTFLTVAVIIALFAFFSTILYMQILYNSERGTEFGLKTITNEVIAKRIVDFPEPKKNKPPGPEWSSNSLILLPPKPNFFFVKADTAGNLIYASRGVTIEDTDLQKLIRLSIENPAAETTIPFGHTDFAFLKTPLSNEDAYLIVYNDLSNQNYNMSVLLRHIIITGILSALLAWLLIYRLSKYVTRPIEISVEQQQHFVSDASHELRTPLTIIQTNLDIIAGAAPDETITENKKWLQNIQEETSSMTELINTLLFLARADANHQLLEKEYFLLQPVLQKSLTAFEPIAQRKNIALACTADSSLAALGDAARVQQVLTILLDNALRHTPSGGSVTISAAQDTAWLSISVTDTGEGIAAQHLDKIFNRFYQVDESRHKGGSGLGLSMAKWIIEKHGGQIYAESTAGQGAAFIIKLPV